MTGAKTFLSWLAREPEEKILYLKDFMEKLADGRVAIIVCKEGGEPKCLTTKNKATLCICREK